MMADYEHETSPDTDDVAVAAVEPALDCVFCTFCMSKAGPRVHWVGVFDRDLRHFDVHAFTPYGTTYNAYLLIGPSKTVLIDTVKEPFYDEMVSRIRSVLKANHRTKIDAIVVLHTEPDHSGSLGRLVTEEFSDVKVIGSRVALQYLGEIANEKLAGVELVNADKNPVLELGDGNDGWNLEFFSAPFLHWPDSMFGYCEALSMLFTCDFLGTHFCHEDVVTIDELGSPKSDLFAKYEHEFKYYYDLIFAPFPKFVLGGASIIDGLVSDGRPLKTIATSHGPVLTEHFLDNLKSYQGWASSRQLEDKVTLLYVSAYGFTKSMAEGIAAGIKRCGVPVNLFDALLDDEDEIARSLTSSKGILFGSPTMVRDSLPELWHFLHSYVNPVTSKGQIGATFGSYGWSGEATRFIGDRLRSCSVKTPLDPLVFKFRPTEDDLRLCEEFGIEFARVAFDVQVDEDVDVEVDEDEKKEVELEVDLDAEVESGEVVHSWECDICGEVVDSVGAPAEACPLCGAKGDNVWTDLGPAEADPEVLSSGSSSSSSSNSTMSMSMSGSPISISAPCEPIGIVGEMAFPRHPSTCTSAPLGLFGRSFSRRIGIGRIILKALKKLKF